MTKSTVNGRILATIPARSGSKGIRNKNQQTIGGVTLTEWAVEHAAMVADAIVISTDDDRYEYLTDQYKHADDPVSNVHIHKRPSILCGDTSLALDVWRDAATSYPGYNWHLYLEPTAPFRDIKVTRECLRELETYPSVMTVHQVADKYNAVKQFYYEYSRVMPIFSLQNLNNPPRQSLRPTYIRNGLCYAARYDYLLYSCTMVGEDTGVVICEGEMFNIDTPEDLERARKYYRRHYQYEL